MLTSSLLFDIGINNHNEQSPEAMAEVLQRALAVGVEHVMLTGTSVASVKKAQALVDAHGREAGGHGVTLCTTVGVHPHYASHCKNVQASMEELEALASHPSVAAVGECGLDFDRMNSPRQQCVQEQRSMGVGAGLGRARRVGA